jgi:hypothetical protein
MTELASLVLFTADAVAAARFYRAVGVPLQDEDHGEGPVHAAAELGDLHFALYPATAPGRAPERRSAGSSFPASTSRRSTRRCEPCVRSTRRS